ncbi:MAG: winged helix-turn-helix domain-containing protein [Gemmatimonadota bacterium]
MELDRLIHPRVRLGIASALAAEESLTFNELRERLDTSDGNLSSHAPRLEEAGYLDVRKSFEGRVPRTDYRLTEEGRMALERYLDHMEALIEQVRE